MALLAGQTTLTKQARSQKRQVVVVFGNDMGEKACPARPRAIALSGVGASTTVSQVRHESFSRMWPVQISYGRPDARSIRFLPLDVAHRLKPGDWC